MNLKKFRKSAKMTQKQVGEYLGVAESTYNLYESEKRKIDYEYLLKLAELYGTTVEQLVNGRPIEKTIDYHRPSEQAKASEPEEISKKMLRFALWGSDSEDMTSEDVEAVLNYAEFLRQKKRGQT